MTPFSSEFRVTHTMVLNFLKIWNSEISKNFSKISTLGFLRRNLKNCPTSCRRNAYLSLVRSAIEYGHYGATVWDPYLQQDIDRLHRVQRRGARFITGDYKSRSPGCVTQMLVEHNLLSMQERRKHVLSSCLRCLRGRAGNYSGGL